MMPGSRSSDWLSRGIGISCTVLLTLGCEPEPVLRAQLLLHVETDAPIPERGLAPEDLTLFDRLRVSVHRGREVLPCAGCTRDFVLDADTERGALSIGVAVASENDVAHVELYAARNLDRHGNPDVGSSLAAWVRLPKPDDEVRPLHVTLTMAALGLPRGALESPIEGSPAAPSPALVRWPEAKRTPCTATPPQGEACVPGGVVWMGDAVRRPGPAGGLRPRLVKMSPFFLDAREVTVRELRESGLATAEMLARPDREERQLCTYSPSPSAADDLPVTCVPRDVTADYCAARGKDLPTEAQHEYVHGGMRGSLYPWGDDDPSCADAVFGRDRARQLDCNESGVGPRVGGYAARDAVEIGGVTVVDLAGNVSEWVREDILSEDAECNRPGYHVDPICSGISGIAQTRGGSFEEVPLGLRSEIRYPASVPIDDRVGFRCVRRLP